MEKLFNSVIAFVVGFLATIIAIGVPAVIIIQVFFK